MSCSATMKIKTYIIHHLRVLVVGLSLQHPLLIRRLIIRMSCNVGRLESSLQFQKITSLVNLAIQEQKSERE